MSDPIKAALDVAKHAALRHESEKRIKRGDTLWRDTPPDLVDECVAECMSVYRQGYAWSDVVNQVPATIAAFLRRAADVHAGCYGRMEPRELLKHIAAAVERASQGERRDD